MCKCIMLVLLSLVLLTGCTVDANRIYVICRIDGDNISCYNNEEEFFTVGVDGSLLPSIDPTLRALPALHFEPESGEYTLQYVLPGLYTGTLHDLERYVYTLRNDGFTTFDILYSDYQKIEMLLHSDSDTYRILYNIYGEVRIYSENNSPILYINGE